MEIEISRYKIVAKIFFANNFKIAFVGVVDSNDVMILELTGVVGYFDYILENQGLQVLRIDKEAGSYGYDLSLRLKMHDVAFFPETFVFVDKECTEYCFRGVAQKIEFRAKTEADQWLS